MPLITVVGSGRVGTSAALQIALRELGDIVLLDIIEGLPQGEALDLSHMAASRGIDVEFTGSNDYRDMAGSDVVVITAGMVRKAGMTRMDLLSKNTAIVSDVAGKVKEHAADAIVIVVTNPLDVMTYVALKRSGFGRERVFGFSGLLDLSRFKYLIARELEVSYRSIESVIIGEHGETMVLLPRLTRVGGKPLEELLSRDKIGEIVEKTRRAGAEVISLKGWSAHHAPGEGVAEMVDSVIRDRKEVIPSSVYLQGEYGVRDVNVVVPAVLGRRGVERIVELELNEEERGLFMKSVETLRKAQAEVDSLLQQVPGA